MQYHAILIHLLGWVADLSPRVIYLFAHVPATPQSLYVGLSGLAHNDYFIGRVLCPGRNWSLSWLMRGLPFVIYYPSRTLPPLRHVGSRGGRIQLFCVRGLLGTLLHTFEVIIQFTFRPKGPSFCFAFLSRPPVLFVVHFKLYTVFWLNICYSCYLGHSKLFFGNKLLNLFVRIAAKRKCLNWAMRFFFLYFLDNRPEIGKNIFDFFPLFSVLFFVIQIKFVLP